MIKKSPRRYKIYEVKCTALDGELTSNQLIARSLNPQFSVMDGMSKQKTSKQAKEGLGQHHTK